MVVQVASRLRSASPTTVDALLVAAVAFPTLMDAWWNEAGTRQADAATYLLAVTSVLVLVVRRRWPIPVAIVSGASLSGLYLLGHHGELLNLPAMVALYTIAAQGDRRTTVVTAVVASAWSGLLGFTSDDPIGARGGSPMLEMIWPLVPLALGDAVRSRRQLAAYAQTEREREAHRRVEAERLRMAREFHDVVAHTMAAVNVQMAAAVAAFDTDPETARQALHQARTSSKAALNELRATVALSRNPEPAAPAPTLDQISELIRPARAAGIEVTLRQDYAVAGLSAAVELAAYRLVQEAITNVLRHSNARSVTVSLDDTSEGFVVKVTDDGTDAAPGQVVNDGFGLTGMAERVHAVGGCLQHGPTPDGGYRVRAVLPTTSSTS